MLSSDNKTKKQPTWRALNILLPKVIIQILDESLTVVTL